MTYERWAPGLPMSTGTTKGYHVRFGKAAAVTAAVIGLVIAPTAAQSATDTTPPMLKTPIAADFLVGASLTPESYWAGCGGVGQFTDLTETFKWTGSDNSGYVRYDVVEPTNEEDVILERHSTDTTITTAASNYDHDCGGENGPAVFGWDVTARDAAGNSITNHVSAGFGFFQDDNAAISYTGSWAVSHCNCWSGLTTHDTSTANASAAITVPSGTHHVGIVMPVGPPQGSAKVLVDGVLKATVNTYATSKSPRVIVWNGLVTATQSHTIKIVNLATAGHPRIDLDAVLTD